MASRAHRRQAAALVVSTFFTMGKKSTAQPRPQHHVPPKGIGPINEPNSNDVLCGRGGRINAHEGNVQFRDIVTAHKNVYLAKTTKKLEKAHIAARIIEQIRTMNPPGRFLKEDAATGMWWDIGDAKAIKKAGQALREDAPEIRPGSDEDDVAGTTKKSPPSGASKKPSPSPPNKRAAPSIKHQPEQIPLAPPAATRGLSWHSTGSSTFGLPFPSHAAGAAAIPPAPASAGVQPSFPSTASVESNGMHSLSSGTALQNNLYSMPNQLYQGIRGASKTASGLSKKAAEIMHMQLPAASQHAHLSRRARDPNDELFGRVFTPTEISSGSTISTMSGGMSGMSGYSARSGSKISALSLGSFGGAAPPGTSLRMSQISNALHNRRGSSQNRGNSNGLSDLTQSFMSTSGLTRSPSFGDLSSTAGGNDSLAALLREEREAGDAFLMHSGMPPPPRSSAMSITSLGSDSAMAYSVKSMNSTNSWLQPYVAQQQQAGSVAAQTAASTGIDSTIWDERSTMSDVSESISALDLAGGSSLAGGGGSSIYSHYAAHQI